MLSRFSHVQLFVSLWSVACQAPLSVEFSRQEYWNGLPHLSPGIFLTQGSHSRLWLLHHRQDSLLLSHWGSPNTGRVPKSSTPFWSNLSKDRSRFCRYSPIGSLSAYDTSDNLRLLPMFLTNHLQIGNSHYLLKLRVPITSPSFCLCFWPTCGKSEIPTVIWKLNLLLGECWVRRHSKVKE